MPAPVILDIVLLLILIGSALTGWRMGYCCGPAVLMAAMTKIHQYAIMCAPTVSQYASIEALRTADHYRIRLTKCSLVAMLLHVAFASLRMLV